jgi:cell division protein FtsW
MIARAEQVPLFGVRPTSAVTPERPRYDVILLGAVLALVALGVVMVYSSSAVFARVVEQKDSAFYLKRQAAFALAGLVAMAAIMRIGYRRLQAWAYPLLILSGVLIVATFIPGLGVRAGHAQRWLRLPGFQLQPSELAKIALCIYLARSVAEKGESLKSFKIGFLPHAMVVGVFCALVLAQPDFGTMVVMLLLMLLVLFVAGARMTYVAVAIGLAVPLAYGLIVSSPYRMRRIEAFLHPFEHGLGSGYQVAQALTSVGSGGLFGLGLGQGREKLGFLPAGHTDYILASIGEELGLVGIAVTLGLFAVIIWRGIKAAMGAADPFGTYLAFGITALFAVEAAINSGMCLGLLPSKGLALPFLSYGGTSLVKAMIAAGILLSISGGGGGYLEPATGAVRRS